MSIVLPTHRARGMNPEPTPPARARRGVRAVRGIELQTAREAAGYTLESLARRMIVLLRLRQGKDFSGVLSEYDEGTYLPSLTRALEFMERVTQATYDRTVSWWNDPESRPAERKGRPRLNLREYDEAFAAIALGTVDSTVQELNLLQQTARDAERTSRQKANRQRIRERATAIACLVWNQADDPEFLDQALFEELRGSGHPGDPNLTGADGYLVRAVLRDLADELRVMFPHRPQMDWREEAA